MALMVTEYKEITEILGYWISNEVS
jgi:hypothetical protein